MQIHIQLHFSEDRWDGKKIKRNDKLNIDDQTITISHSFIYLALRKPLSAMSFWTISYSRNALVLIKSMPWVIYILLGGGLIPLPGPSLSV